MLNKLYIFVIIAVVLFIPYYWFASPLVDSFIYEGNSPIIIDKEKSTWVPNCANYIHQDIDCKYLKEVTNNDGIIFDEDMTLFDAEIASLKPCKQCCKAELTLFNRIKSIGIYYGVLIFIILLFELYDKINRAK